MERLNSFDSNTVDESYMFIECKGHYIDGMFDFHASAGTNVLGYSNPEILNKVHRASLNSNTGFWKLNNQHWKNLAKNLSEITNDKYESFLPALTGSDSVDNAIKLSWMYWNYIGTPKKYILIRKNSFHSGSISGWQMNYLFDKTQFPDFKFVEFYDNLEETIKKNA